MTAYRWKESGAANVEAQVAGDELERIRVHNNGRLEPEDVVDASRPSSAPLHPVFEWDDSKAAEAHRRSQAAHVIRHLDVVIEAGEKHRTTRAFVSVKRDDDRSYTSTAHALSDAELRQQVVDQALSELAAWRNRYAELTDLAALFAAIDQARSAN